LSALSDMSVGTCDLWVKSNPHQVAARKRECFVHSLGGEHNDAKIMRGFIVSATLLTLINTRKIDFVAKINAVADDRCSLCIYCNK